MVRIGNRSISLYKAIVIVLDMAIIFVSLAFALQLRFDFTVPSQFIDLFEKTWPVFVSTAAILFFMFGFYDQIWRFASIRQYMILFFGTMVQPVIAAIYMIRARSNFPRSIYIIYWLVSFVMVVGLRIAYRILANRTSLPALVRRYLVRPLLVLAGLPDPGPYEMNAGSASSQSVANLLDRHRRVMVIGAGAAGSQIIRELQSHHSNRTPVVIIDDNRQTHTFRVLGVPVYGGREAIPAAAVKYQVDEIILAIPSAPRNEVREIVEIASRTGCELKIIPFLHDLIDGNISIKDIKDVEIEDLLGRDEIVLDTEAIADYLRGQTVLVTGGGGSIGSELCRQIARFQPARLIVFDIYENNAYQLQYELLGTVRRCAQSQDPDWLGP